MNNSLKVLNYTPNVVAVTTRNRSITLPGAKDGVPTFDWFALDEIEYINSQSPAFRSGLLELDDESVYAHLNIDKDKCIFERDIDDMIVNATAEKLQKIVDATDTQTIERVRGHMEYLIRIGVGVSSKVTEVVNERFKELNRGLRKSNIQVTIRAKESPVANEVASLKDELAELKSLLKAQVKTEEPKVEEPKVAEVKPIAPAKKTPAKRTTTAKKAPPKK